ncbi:MAG: hypothetical protein L0Z62_31535 [Gemmataceae bacterium]|nr:hypothetical protein [Gemmataceae bacterium]
MTLRDLLSQDPSGDIRLTGQRLGLYHVIERYQEGFSPEMLHEEYPTRVLGFPEKEAFMESIPVSDLPEPVARAIEALVEAVRRQLAQASAAAPPARELPRLEGNVIGTLSREELYDDDANP